MIRASYHRAARARRARSHHAGSSRTLRARSARREGWGRNGCRPDRSPPMNEPRLPEATDDGAIRVLVVEDEIEAARLVTRRLSYYPSAHFVITHVPDLGSAFARIEDEAFDVMVLDLGLPDADGFTTIASACGVAR